PRRVQRENAEDIEIFCTPIATALATGGCLSPLQSNLSPLQGNCSMGALLRCDVSVTHWLSFWRHDFQKGDQFAASPRNATCAFHFRPGFISPTKRSGARRPRESCIDDLQPHTASPTPNSRYFGCRESRRLPWIFDHLPTRGHHES